jgi:hypothetical protein
MRPRALIPEMGEEAFFCTVIFRLWGQDRRVACLRRCLEDAGGMLGGFAVLQKKGGNLCHPATWHYKFERNGDFGTGRLRGFTVTPAVKPVVSHSRDKSGQQVYPICNAHMST